MKVLVTGGAKNGKSGLAQKLCCSLSAEGKRFYVATMMPYDDEDRLRIKRHLEDRKNLNFTTLECPKDIHTVIKNVSETGSDSCFLVDSLTALLANEMFAGGKYDCLSAQKVSANLYDFARGVSNAVFVSDGIFCDSFLYDDVTEAYRKGLAFCERTLAQVCDTVIEMTAGIPVVHKGSLDMIDGNASKKLSLIIGGAHQGKLSYAKMHYSLTENDISVCAKDCLPDFSKKCIVHIENYVWFCLKNGMEPCCDFLSGTVIVSDDIFCGIVPIDAFERKWRETCGLYLQKIASMADVTRIICGLPQKLK